MIIESFLASCGGETFYSRYMGLVTFFLLNRPLNIEILLSAYYLLVWAVFDILKGFKFRVTPKKYSWLIKRKMYIKREIFKTELFLDYQCANFNFDILVLIFVLI